MASLEVLKGSVRGSVIEPGDGSYEDVRKIWNGMIDLRPKAIVRCLGTADIVKAVGFARESGWPLAIRGGGHNAAGLALCDDGLVIDLSLMRGVHVDPKSRTARAQGGATWGDFDSETSLHGLATTGGAISTTGIAGLTLGGGIGWLMRKYGLSCDNLLSVDLVTAQGELARASAAENDDLFWGVRGGGGNFGIVTSFEYRLHPVSTVLGGMLVYPAGKAREVLSFYRDFNESAPEELTIFATLMTTPDGARVVALLVGYHGPVEEGEKVLRPLRKFGPPLADQVGPMSYTALQTMLDEAFPPGLQVYWRSNFLGALSDGALDEIVSRFKGITSPLSAMLLEPLGGAVSRVEAGATAFNHRDAHYNFAIVGRWATPDPSEASKHIAWIRGTHEAMEPFTTGGVYVNYLGEEGEDRVRAAYGAEKYGRLVALKKKYDPNNLFRRNQNIKPA